MRCGACGLENATEARFCNACGAKLTVAAERQTRKTVTVLFTDLAESTALGERLDPEAMRSVMSRYFAAAREVIENHGGRVEKFIGDAVMAVFGVPTLHEDDALRAVRAATQMREHLARLNVDLQRERGLTIETRTGIDTGAVVSGDPAIGETLVTGSAVNMAARLQQAAEPGQILLGEATFRLVRDLVSAERMPPFAAKGKADPVQAFRLLSLPSGPTDDSLRPQAVMVGRERELARLNETWRDTVSERSPHLFTVLGLAGVGKSRLIHEFIDAVRADGAQVLRGRCLPYGEGITFWPVGEIVRSAAGIVDADKADEARAKLTALVADIAQGDVLADRIASAIGLSSDLAPQAEVFWAIRKLFEGLAERDPLLVVFDDIHWAEPTLLDALEHITDWSRDVPLLLVCVARPELLESRPDWGGGKLNATTLLLESLRVSGMEALVESLLGGEVDGAILERVAAAAEGNPLFVEQVVAMLVEDGHIVRSGARWEATRDLSAIAVPPTVMAVIAARLDRLQAPERSVAERAAVVGRVFERPAVVELTPEDDRAGVVDRLGALVRKELIRTERSSASDDVFRFRHVLIRDAAYEAIPKTERAELHERFADWLERVTGDRLAELEEIVGHHFATAFDLRREIGDDEARAAAIGRRAAAHLAPAGLRAFVRGDMPAAVRIWARAAHLLPIGDPSRLDILPDLGFALFSTGRIQEAEAHLQSALQESRTAASIRHEVRVGLELGQIRILRVPIGLAAAQADAEQAVRILADLGDDVGLAKAWQLVALISWMRGRSRDAQKAQERANAHFQRAGIAGMERHLTFFGAECYGPQPATEAVAALEEDVRAGAADPLRQGRALQSLCVLYAMQGRAAESREALARGRQSFLDLGMTTWALSTSEMAAIADLVLGRAAEAETAALTGAAELEAIGAVGYGATHRALAAYAVARQGRPLEALALAELAQSATSEEDIGVQVISETARCASLLDLGRVADAVEAGRTAVRHARTTDFISWHADALLELARALHASDMRSDAKQAVGEARALYLRKGNVMGSQRATQVMSELGEQA